MFFEVCLLSLGLFTGSELYKKFESSAGKKSHNCGLRRKQEQPGPSVATREKEHAERESVQNHAEFGVALEALTQEVSKLREEFADYLAANKESKERSVSRKDVPSAAPERRPAPGTSIFDKLIEENVSLRKE